MKILLPVDGSDYTKRMLAYLAAHDELLGAGHEHILLNVVPELPLPAVRVLQQSVIDSFYAEESEGVFRPLRAFAEQQHWKVRMETVYGRPAVAIAEFAEREKPDLIVMGSHGHTALGNVTLGSVASGVLARCKTPVLLVR
jgi:nucleotide-binding universal stress UspA family protein